jgi:hypothetical protein
MMKHKGCSWYEIHAVGTGIERLAVGEIRVGEADSSGDLGVRLGISPPFIVKIHSGKLTIRSVARRKEEACQHHQKAYP